MKTKFLSQKIQKNEWKSPPRDIFSLIEQKYFFLLFISLLSLAGCHQSKKTDLDFNLDFEIVENGMPKGWVIYPQPGYSVSLDSKNVKSGKYSIAIEYTGNSTIGNSIGLRIPDNYDGSKITLSGYMKTKNVTDGYAGLILTLYPSFTSDTIAVTGTSDWKKYELTVELNPASTKYIMVMGILDGKGKMWLDDLQVTIDGVDIKDAKIYEKKPLPAELDKAFPFGSNIIIQLSKNPDSKEDKSLISNLDLLGKLWGFLKYHHPEVGKGNYNWDNELFRILPEYLKSNGPVQRDEILLRWIEKYGDIPECTTCKETSVDAVLKPDLSWVDHFNMSSVLKNKINEIYKNRHQGDHFYIGKRVSPVFSNEKPYSNFPYPDTGIRMLALYRYWNMVHYFFPSKHLTDKNWNDVLKEYITKFILAETTLEYQLAILQLTGEINDSHAFLRGADKIDALRGGWQAPFGVRFIENKLVVTDYYKPELKDSAGLHAGDIITHINGKKIETIIDSMRTYYPASNEAARMRDLVNDLVRSKNMTILVDYISSDQIKQKELTLHKRNSLNMNKKDNSMFSYQILSDNILVTKEQIGYIVLNTIKNSNDIDVIKKSSINAKGIIIDIRNYPSMDLGNLVSCYFSENKLFMKVTTVNINNPGEITFGAPFETPKSENPYQGKLVVIVNEITQSAAEGLAMAFQARDNTTFIGSPTAGAHGNISEIVLPGGLKTWFSGVGVYFPDGREIQRAGLIPDIEVKPTIQGIREGRDELLEKAIEIIKQGSK